MISQRIFLWVCVVGLVYEAALGQVTRTSPENEDFFFTAPGFEHVGLARTVAGAETGKLQITVLDLSTGLPTPCRIAVVGPDGHYYQPPKNRLSPYAMTGKWPNPGDWGNRPQKAPWRYLGRYFYSTGQTEVAVPPGKVRVEVSKGWEYAPQTHSLLVTTGQQHAVQIELKRAVSMSQEGYFNGDVHLHFPRASKGDDELIFDLLEAEDIQYGTTLAYNEPAGPYAGAMTAMDSPQYREFGLASQRTRGKFHILSGQEYRSVHYGHIMYYLHDRIVHENRQFNIDDGPVFGQTSSEVLAHGGLAIMAHGGYSQEIYADVALGALNAVELLQFGIYRELGLTDWYHMLNSGYRIAAFGACDFPACRFLGDARTYVWTPTSDGSEPSLENWLRAGVSGQSFISTGPMLLIEVNQRRPGEMLAISGDEPVEVKVSIRARCEVTPLQHIDLIVNGEVVQRLDVPPQQALGQWITLEQQVQLTASSWLAARAWSTTPGGQPDAESHTNPVYVNFNNRRAYQQSSIDAWIKKIDGQMEYHTARQFSDKAGVLAYFQNARDVLLKIRAQGGFAADVESLSLLTEAQMTPANLGQSVLSESELQDYLQPVPPTAPAVAEKSFEVPAGFSMQLVAAEPLVVDPIAAAFDADGQLYVCEMRDYPFKPAPGKQPLGTVRLLRDTDGDGRFDSSTVFADELLWAAGVVPWKRGIFVAASPDIWYLRDDDGDGVADIRRKIFTGFGVGNQQGMVNNLQLGLDHWIYGSTGPNGGMITKPNEPDFTAVPIQGRDFRFHPDTLEFEAITGTVQFGNTFDDFGNRFTCSESQPLQHIVMPEHYLARNPFLSPPRGLHNLAPGPVPIFRISPVERWREIRSLRRVQKNERSASAAGASHHVIDAAAGVTIYRGGAYPSDWYGQAFVGDGQNNLVHRRRLLADGVTFASERVDAGTEVIRSPDIWFRPVNALNAPDGTLYFLDMSREVLESIHIPLDVAKYLDFKSGREFGRIYRLAPPDFRSPQPPQLSHASTAELVSMLESPHGWYRDTAHRLLFERQDATAVSLLEQLAMNSTFPATRLHALWSLAGLGQLDSRLLLAGMNDPHPAVQEHALRLAERLLDQHPRLLAKLVELADSPHPRLRFQAAFSLGESSSPAASAALTKLARQPTDDIWMRTAILSSVVNFAGELFENLLSDLGSSNLSTGQRTNPHPSDSELVKAESTRLETAETDNLALISQLAHLIGVRNQAPEMQHAVRALQHVRDLEIADQLLLELGRGNRTRGTSIVLDRFSAEARTWLTSRFEQALSTARDQNAADSIRVRAIELCGCFASVGGSPHLLELLSADSPEAVQIALINTLADAHAPALGEQLLEHWSSFSPEAKRIGWQIVLSKENLTIDFLRAAEQQRVSLTELDSIQREGLRQHRNPTIQSLAFQALERVPSATRQSVVQAYQPALDMQGNVASGATVFEKNCAACHQVAGKGVNIGPNLASSASQSASTLLTHILDPNQIVQPNYVVYLALDSSGRAHTGLLAAQTSTSVTLKKERGETVTLLKSEIEELTSRRTSLMPEGLEQTISIPHMADLIAFLQEMTQKTPGDPYSERDRGTLAGSLFEE
jgi:putative membrane-bound dehydrogenase-like protein